MLLGILIIFSVYVLIISTVSNVKILMLENSFKKGAVLDETISTSKKKFYNVSRETSEQTFTLKGGKVYPGSYCDILVRLESSNNLPVLHDIFTYTVGGHAGLLVGEYDDVDYSITDTDSVETAFNNDEKECFYDSVVEWEDRASYYVLRVNLTDEQKHIVTNEVISCLDDPYNLTFILNTYNTHYCTDLISKAFKKVGINLNENGFATTCQDLICSKNTQIVFMKQYNQSEDISYYYYA